LAAAQPLQPLPVVVSGEAAETDPFQMFVQFSGGFQAPLHDLYKFTLPAPTIVWISLEPIGNAPKNDLDLYLFRNVNSNQALPTRFSATETPHELIAVRLSAGTWFIGVSAFAGDVQYLLQVVPQAP